MRLDIPFRGTVTPSSEKILRERYYAAENKETKPEDLFKRVSCGNDTYFHLMNDLAFLPNSPTLFNCGLDNGCTLSACFVFDIEDSMLEGENCIMNTEYKAASVAKAGGGVGYYFGHLRKKGAPIRSVHRQACGPVAVLRRFHTIRNLIKQGARRDLAQMGVLNADHPDIYEWIHAKDEDPKALESFNLSVSWPDRMMEQVNALIDETDKANPETALFWEQCRSAWKTGCPGMLFDDAINRANATPHRGRINATNPCGETPNLNNEPCNLGSLAVCRFLKKVGTKFVMAWDLLRDAVRASIRFLDDILDWNTFPHPAIDKAARDTRKLGLGVMGLADAFAMMGLPYDSNEAVDYSEHLMSFIDDVAVNESRNLAVTKGSYPAWEDGTEDTKKKFVKARNSTRTSIAPTGTISIIAGVSSAIEPYFALTAERTTFEGIKMPDGVPDWVKPHIPTGHIPNDANNVHWKWHVKHQAAFQKNTDLGVSKTINMPNTATVQDIASAYHYMWKTGCKGGTIYRDGCRSEQVIVAKKDGAKGSVYRVNDKGIDLTDAETRKTIRKDLLVYEKEDFPWIKQEAVVEMTPEMAADVDRQFKEWADGPIARHLILGGINASPVVYRKLPRDCESRRHKFKFGGTEGYLHVGLYEDGTVGEIFLRSSIGGSTLNGMIDAWAMAFSVALQRGTPLDVLVRLHAGQRFEPCGPTGNPDVPICTSIPDYVVRLLEARYLKPKVETSVEGAKPVGSGTKSGIFCPDCGSELLFQAGCLTCVIPGCGFSKCG